MNAEAYIRFWDCFQNHKESLETEQFGTEKWSLVFNEVRQALSRVDPDLVIEIDTQSENDKQCTISANGVRELIEVVQGLTAQAPQMAGWKIIALRQRKDLDQDSLSINGFNLNPNNIFCSISSELRRIDVHFYFAELSGSDYYSQLELAYLLLDAAVGEKDVANKVGEIFLHTIAERPRKESFPLRQLANRFDNFSSALTEQLQQRERSNIQTRREVLVAEVIAKAKAQAEALLEDSIYAGGMVSIEMYFKEPNQDKGEQLLEELEEQFGMAVERIDYGSVQEGITWVHAWIEESPTIINAIPDLVNEIAQRGFEFDCELEGLFLSPAEERSAIDGILASLEEIPEAGAIMEAHRALEADEPQRAVEVLEDAIEEDPCSIELRGLLAYSYAKMSNAERAQECLEELHLEMDGDRSDAGALWNIACAYALLQDAQNACENLKFALEIDPELRELAVSDPDLIRLKGIPEFDKLLYQA